MMENLMNIYVNFYIVVKLLHVTYLFTKVKNIKRYDQRKSK